LVRWVFWVLLAANVVLFLALVGLREQWAMFARRRERVRVSLAPIIDRMTAGDDTLDVVQTIRPIVARMGPQERPVAAWLLLEAIEEVDESTRMKVRGLLEDSGAIGLAERSTRRWTPWRRALACEILGAVGSKDSVPVLVSRLEDRRVEVRMAAVRALGMIGSPEAAEALTPLFLDRKGIPSGVAFDALRRLGPAGAEVFRQGLRSSNPTTRVESCFGIAATSGTADSSTARALLAAALSDADARVRTAAARALGRLGGEVAPPGLSEAVNDADVRVRREAVTALGALDDPATVELLERLVLDDDRETALRSAESLLALAERPQSNAAALDAIERSSGWAMAYARTVAQMANPGGRAA
jgi:hypothetical protein